jgi:hypothetical protein
LLSPYFAVLIQVLKADFFPLGLQYKLSQEEIKNMEWQRESMATFGTIKSFDPIK